jgi:hypothetical protein
VVEVNDVDLTADGYIFAAPFEDDQPSPLIFDASGTLIWDGAALVAGSNAYDFHTCSRTGEPFLCFVSGALEIGYARGQIEKLDERGPQA